MAIVFYSFVFLLAAGGATSGDGALGWWFQNVDPYLNYPGFEAWRFFNLGLFALVMYYILRKPLSEAFKAKREAIRAELIQAEEEKQAALVELEGAESDLEKIESEKGRLLERARNDAKMERERIAGQAEETVNRMRAQAESELVRSRKLAKLDLRRYSAEESVRLAEEKIRSVMSEQKDAELVRAATRSIGGMA